MHEAAPAATQMESVLTPAHPAECDIWPQLGGAELILAFGLVYLVFGAGGLLGLFLPILQQPMIVLAVVAVAVGLVFGCVQLNKQYKLRSRLNRKIVEPEPRLRAISPSPGLRKALESAQDVSFEPVLWRSVSALHFGELDRESGLIKKRSTKKGLTTSVASSPEKSIRQLGLSDALVAIASFTIVMGLTRAGTGSWKECLHRETIWGAMALTVVLSAFVRPTYIRVAPGVLDLFMYPPLGFGRPRSERFDLRTSRVTVDDVAGWIAVADSGRSAFPVVFLRTRRLIGPRPVASHILAAARVTAPTPPLPMDELSG